MAILDAATRALGIPDAARVVEGRLTSSVPIATALVLDGRAHEGGASLTVVDEGQTLSSASVRVGAGARAGAGGLARRRRRLGPAHVRGLSRVRIAQSPGAPDCALASTRMACGLG